MTRIMNSFLRLTLAASLGVFLFMGCERDVDGLSAPDLSTNPNVFLDTFSSGLQYAVFSNADPTAFEVDPDVTFNNSDASMRFAVPAPNDPNGVYAGGTFYTTSPRNLSEYDALTFYLKASQNVDIPELGFGVGGANLYQVSINNVPANTNWRKVYIPIPNPEKLTSEQGMFYYSASHVDSAGYTFWIDEVKFEKTGSIAHPQVQILDGQDIQQAAFAGSTTSIFGYSTAFNMPDASFLTVNTSPSYFDFSSADEAIASVNSTGTITFESLAGTTAITASLAGTQAVGSVTAESLGDFIFAPVPTLPQDSVVSLFSNSYQDSPVDFFNGYWQFSTTQSEFFTLTNDAIGEVDTVLNYTNLNFVGIQFTNPTIDISEMEFMHMDIFIPADALAPGSSFSIELVDFGDDNAFGGGNDDSGTRLITLNDLSAKQWVSFELSMRSFRGLSNRANLAQIVLSSVGIPNLYVDNIYFYKND